MTDKFQLTREQNVFLAKRNLVDYIYNSARLEGCNVTFPETYTILEGVNVGSVALDDIQTILNLRDVWRFVLATIDEPLTVEYLCRLNGDISRNESLAWGGITGTDDAPPIPTKESAQALLDQLHGTATERAIALFLGACRAQLFWDGNKRTATLAANKLMLQAGAGILTIRDDDLLEFNKRLQLYYNTNDMSILNTWLYEHSIVGIQFNEGEGAA